MCNSQLIMKGCFQQKYIQKVLRQYTKEYVVCHTCGSPDTILNKEMQLVYFTMHALSLKMLIAIHKDRVSSCRWETFCHVNRGISYHHHISVGNWKSSIMHYSYVKQNVNLLKCEHEHMLCNRPYKYR